MDYSKIDCRNYYKTFIYLNTNELIVTRYDNQFYALLQAAEIICNLM